MVIAGQQLHRRSIRLRGHDYTQPGAYFVTLCTRDRRRLFGHIANGEMQLNDRGSIVQDEWLRTATVRPRIRLDAFVVMPDHLHGIIVISMKEQSAASPNLPRALARPVGATRWVAPKTPAGLRARPGPTPDSIGAMIGQFKAASTKRVNAVGPERIRPLWQRNYYEHVIRDSTSFDRLRQYILENPARWRDR